MIVFDGDPVCDENRGGHISEKLKYALLTCLKRADGKHPAYLSGQREYPFNVKAAVKQPKRRGPFWKIMELLLHANVRYTALFYRTVG